MFTEVKCCKSSKNRKSDRAGVGTDRCSLKRTRFCHGWQGKRGAFEEERKAWEGMFIGPACQSEGISEKRDTDRNLTVRLRIWALMTEQHMHVHSS